MTENERSRALQAAVDKHRGRNRQPVDPKDTVHPDLERIIGDIEE